MVESGSELEMHATWSLSSEWKACGTSLDKKSTKCAYPRQFDIAQPATV